MTTKLIQLSDIKAIKPISDNIDSLERLDPYIIEAQDLDIRPFLGEPLFYDIASSMNGSPNPYALLLSGGAYTNNENTIYFDGLGIAIAYFAYARFISNQGINISRYGVVRKVNEHSEPVSEEMVDRLAGNARSIGLAYLNNVERYLDNDYELPVRQYPLWREEIGKRPRTHSKITKVTNH